MTQPPAPKSVQQLYCGLEHRSYSSYKSRLKAWERIRARSQAWNTALIALAAATTVASVGLLVDGTMYGTSGEVFLVACAVLALAASLTVSSLDYPGRAAKMEINYKDLQAHALHVEAARSAEATPTLAHYEALNTQYIDLLRNSENHTTADWNATSERLRGRSSLRRILSLALTFLPYVTLALPGWLLVQFGVWVVRGAS